MLRYILLILALGAVAEGFWRKEQFIKVKGRLLCGNDKPLANVKVVLEDYDAGPSPDDEIEEGVTDSQGRFELSGTEKEVGKIDPVIKIFHDCNDGKPCQRQWERKIPKKYIDDRNGADIGTINLELVDSSEERDCIN